MTDSKENYRELVRRACRNHRLQVTGPDLDEAARFLMSIGYHEKTISKAMHLGSIGFYGLPMKFSPALFGSWIKRYLDEVDKSSFKV